MERVTVELQNCYGIKKLNHVFDFSQRKVYAVYAPNGAMKSSFAETFKNVADGQPSKDRIFPGRVSVRRIVDENGVDLPKESVLVLPPYDEMFGHSAKTSTLLLNSNLKKEYDQLSQDLELSKKTFLMAMQKQSASKKELEREVALTFMKVDEEGSFYVALERINSEMEEQNDSPFADVKYDSVFDEKVLAALGAKDMKAAIEQYVLRYNELLAASTYFSKGVFEYYNAAQIAKTLSDNGFFEAKHTITLNAGEKLVISTPKELEDLVAKELDNITKDKDLKKKFSEIKKQLEKNATVRDFQKYLCDHELLLPQLGNIELFRERVWKSYFKANESLYKELLGQYRKVKARRKEIEEEARKETTQWEAAIDLFNDRFFVPFKLEAKNKIQVALGHESLLDLSYRFEEPGDSTPVVRETLLKSLSQGERKALYILNIIFEIEVRRNAKQETLFVVDDIADSFDYKNKYAIIQYLQEIAEGPVFKQIILTHNFDFFRTICGRFVGYGNCLMATKTDTEVSLPQAWGINNPFVKDWKAHFFSDRRKRIASISFMRNLIEYTVGTSAPDYVTLTSLLHWKPDSPTITQDKLDSIYSRLFGGTEAVKDPATPVVDAIMEEADLCLKVAGGVNFEHKIVLSIAVRLCAERFMADKIADAKFLAGITENQTPKLLAEFKRRFPAESAAIRAIQDVVLVTPENIHLNAFMYEPILDMSDDHLKRLYTAVRGLK